MTDGSDAQQPGRFTVDAVLAKRPRSLRQLPMLIRSAVTLSWQAARREFTAAALLQLAGGGAIAVQLLLGKRILDQLVGGDPATFVNLLPDVVAFGVLTVLVAVANLAKVEQQRLLSELVARFATRRVIDVACAVELIEFDDPGFHDRLQRARLNAVARPPQISMGILTLLASSFAIGGISVALLLLEPLFLALIFAAYIPVWLVSTQSSRLLHRFSIEQTERDRRRSYLFQVLTEKAHAAEVRAFDLAPYLGERHDLLHHDRITEMRRMVQRRLRLGMVGSGATSVLSACTVGAIVWLVTTGRMDVATAGTAAGAVVLLGHRLQGLASGASNLYEGALFLEDFTSFLSQPLPRRRTTGNPEGSPVLERLEASAVTFTYPSRAEPSVRDVSLTVDSGEVIALVGENGSGKTTLAKLLAGLYNPQEGAVRWNGVDLREIGSAPKDAVTIIFQDFAKYHLTVRENIGLGRHEQMDDVAAIREAARWARADAFLATLAQGYETQLGPQFLGGSDLSIGQWQRVALARAFFRGSSLLILDEPTAALDPRAEYELFGRIRDLYRGRTVVLISHRFSSVRSADRIYVLKAGEIIEQGSHGDLMALQGLYAELFTLQASAYLQAEQ